MLTLYTKNTMETPQEPRLNILSPTENPFRHPPLIIVDDEPEIISCIENRLRKQGYFIIVIRHEAVVDFLASSSQQSPNIPDVLILQGAELLNFVRQKWRKEIPLTLLCTAKKGNACQLLKQFKQDRQTP